MRMHQATLTPATQHVGDSVPIETEKGKARAESRAKVRCVVDGTWFAASRSDAKYCSSTCRSKASRAKSNPEPVRAKKKRAKCENCGITFWTARPDQARFHDSKCRWAWHNGGRRHESASAETPEDTNAE